MPYKDPTTQRRYQQQWRETRRQQTPGERFPTLTAWATALGTVQTTCREFSQAFPQLVPHLQGRDRSQRFEVAESLQGLRRGIHEVTELLERLERLTARLATLLPAEQCPTDITPETR